jgi:hypothetical protein
MATRSLLQLDALDFIDGLQPIVSGDPPPAGELHTWQRLVRRGRLPGIPVDPTGVPFALDEETGLITVAPESELHPMPARPTLP